MLYDPKIEIKYRVEYKKSGFTVMPSQFDEPSSDAALEAEIVDYVECDFAANMSIYIENMPHVIAQIREALAIRKKEDEESEA